MALQVAVLTAPVILPFRAVTDPTFPISVSTTVPTEVIDLSSEPWLTPFQFWVLFFCIVVIVATLLKAPPSSK